MMRGRFGRRRRGEGEGGTPVDESWLERAAAALPVERLEPRALDDLPPELARVGAGEGAGTTWLVAVSPRTGAPAAVAAALAALRQPEDQEAANVAALAPAWSPADLAVAARLRVRAVPLPDAAAQGLAVPPAGSLLRPEQLAAGLARPSVREAFERALAGMAGLASKHGGGLRVSEGAVQLLVLARPIASLRASGDAVTLEMLLPSRSTHPVTGRVLAEVLDRLEGNIRRRLAERRVRDGEEGCRGRLLEPLAGALGLRTLRAWPVGGQGEAVDAVGLDAEGTPVLLLARERVGLAVLAEGLRAACAVEPALPALLGEVAPPVAWTATPRVGWAALHWEPAARELLGAWRGELTPFTADTADGPLRALEVLPAERGTLVLGPPPSGAPEEELIEPEPRAEAPRPERLVLGPPVDRSARAAEEEAGGEGPEEEEATAASEERPGRRRGRRRRGRGRRAGAGGRERAAGLETTGDEAEGFADDEGEELEEAPAAGGFEELSLFDLDDESGEERPAGRRRRRGRRRGSARAPSDGEGETDEGEEPPAAARGEERGGDGRRRRKGRGGKGRGGKGGVEHGGAERMDAASGAGGDDDLDEDVLELSPDAPDFDLPEVPAYEDDEEAEEGESEMDRLRLERERRRRARAVSAPELAEAGSEATPEQAREIPRGRTALLVHADRESIVAAVLLAREMRQIEGIWVYPQSELMTFFRGVATDLRENTPIYVVGFTASPARDALQAASLYRGRLVWFDHHDWPPEDLGAMKEAIGEHLAIIHPGVATSLPAVMAFCNRRSRFSDKLVDLVTGRFSQHDFQRWGRLWWWRLGEIAHKTGERRSDLDLLIAGRPSDLAKEASRVAPPPPPEELAYVASHEFRLVLFGGLGMVVAELPDEVDLHLTPRIARDRYGAPLSLARRIGSDVFVLGADEVSGRGSLDVGAMVEHLSQKFSWVEALPDDDHVARFRARPGPDGDRLEQLIAEIGMGRSILEG